MKQDNKSNFSVKYLILILVFSIFSGETMIMLVINKLPPLSEWQGALLDASLLSLLVFPIIYFMAFRPLCNEIKQHEKTANELFTSNSLLLERDKEREEKNFQLLKLNTELSEANEHYRHIFNFSPVGYLILTDKCVIIDINFTGEHLLGAKKDELLNRNIESFLPPEEIEHWRNTYNQLSINNSTQKNHERLPNKQSCKLIVRRDDGLDFCALFDCRRDDPLISSNIRVSFTDITEQRDARLFN